MTNFLHTLPKIYGLKGFQKRNLLAFLSLKLFEENLHEEKLNTFPKRKGQIIEKPLDEFIRKLGHCQRLHY